MKNIFTIFKFFFSIVILPFFSYAQSNVLWGTAYGGGIHAEGRIVQIDASGAVSEKHSFPLVHQKAPASIKGSLIAYNGYLYGTSGAGKYGDGIIYRYNPTTGISELLYDFENAVSGSNPLGGLLLYNDKLYGMTSQGGTNAKGVIYEYDLLTNVFTSKLALPAAIGGSSGAFAQYNNKFYAASASGGDFNYGCIFEYNPVTNSCTKKIDFNLNTTIGAFVNSGLLLLNNKFYGQMRMGGANNRGLIFEYDPSANIYTKKFDLSATTPFDIQGKLATDGTLIYGIANQSPEVGSKGAIISFDPISNIFTTKITFAAATGTNGLGDLFFYNNKFYGTNSLTGGSAGGAFFEYDPMANTIVQSTLLGGNVGSYPVAGLTLLGNKMYGSTTQGNTGLLEWDIATNTLIKKAAFGKNNGFQPTTKLLHYDGKVYGVTSQGGDNNYGLLFSQDLATGLYTVLYSFPSATANNLQPVNTPSILNNKLYGICNSTQFGNRGYFYEYDLATQVFTLKFNLTNSSGYNIQGKFYLHTDNKFYGVCNSGTANGFGGVFSWDPATNVYTNLVNMPAARNANGGFTEAGGKFYVPASVGGTANLGTVIEYNPTTNVLTNPASFTAATGRSPQGEFTALNGKLYTGTSLGGTNSNGSIIEYVAGSNTLTPLYHFIFAMPNLGQKSNGMLAAFNNELYGYAIDGGTLAKGTIFKYNPTTNIFTKIEDLKYGSGTTQVGAWNGFVTVQLPNVTSVTLSYFTAKKFKNTQALLIWQTTHEQHNKGFAIERSNDGTAFLNIGFVKGIGNSALKNEYSFNDNAPLKGKNYYRLKQIDDAGKYNYSKINMLTFENDVAILFPMPFQNEFSILSKKNGVICIVDALGKAILSQKIIATNNKINTANLPAGVYFYTVVYNDGVTEQGQMLKQ